MDAGPGAASVNQALRLYYRSWRFIVAVSLILWSLPAVTALWISSFYGNDRGLALEAAWLTLMLLVSPLFDAAIIWRLHCLTGTASTSWREIASVAAKRWPYLFFTSVLFQLKVLTGLLLFVVPGFYLALCYSFFTPIAVFENAYPSEILRKSKALVSGRFRDIFKHLAFLTIISLACEQLISALLPGEAQSWWVIEKISGQIVWAFYTVGLYVLYRRYTLQSAGKETGNEARA